MNLELDHVFILVKSEARVADLLIAQGFEEGTRFMVLTPLNVKDDRTKKDELKILMQKGFLSTAF